MLYFNTYDGKQIPVMGEVIEAPVQTYMAGKPYIASFKSGDFPFGNKIRLFENVYLNISKVSNGISLSKSNKNNQSDFVITFTLRFLPLVCDDFFVYLCTGEGEAEITGTPLPDYVLSVGIAGISSTEGYDGNLFTTIDTFYKTHVKNYPKMPYGYFSNSGIICYNVPRNPNEEIGKGLLGRYSSMTSLMLGNYTPLSPEKVKEKFEDIPVDPEDDDPYKPGGPSGPGGGGGSFKDIPDPIPIPGTPGISAVDSGLVTLFAPTLSQLKSLGNYMWSDLFDLATFKKLVADPMDCILGLAIMPFNVPSEGASTVKVGNISTGIVMNIAAGQYLKFNCGSLAVKEYWGCYQDYEPYTKSEIFLPFIGVQPISTDDIMNKTVEVEYNIDILSGSVVAFVKCDNSVLYTYSGQCSIQVPVNGSNWNQLIQNALTVAGAVAITAVSGGTAAPASGVAALGASAAVTSTVMSSKPHISKSGSISGAAGAMSIKQPYLILTRPRQALPAYQNTYLGYPSHMTEKLSALKGFTEVEKIHLKNVLATDEELLEIERLLKEGVIL